MLNHSSWHWHCLAAIHIERYIRYWTLRIPISRRLTVSVERSTSARQLRKGPDYSIYDFSCQQAPQITIIKLQRIHYNHQENTGLESAYDDCIRIFSCILRIYVGRQESHLPWLRCHHIWNVTMRMPVSKWHKLQHEIFHVETKTFPTHYRLNTDRHHSTTVHSFP